MFGIVWKFIESSVEYQSWGWNALTVSTIGIIIFTFLEGWGLYKQAEKIWKTQSAEALSIRWFSYMGLFFVAAIFYGIHMNSAAIVFNCGTLFGLHLPILVGIAKYHDVRPSEFVQVVLYIGIPIAMWALPWKETMFLIFSFGTVYSLATQPWEMWRSKSSGVVEVKLIIIYLASTLFWATFAFATFAPALMILNPLVIMVFLVTLYLWFKFR